MDYYRCWDQEEKLGRPPWKQTKELTAWEAAHGHDVRLSCDAEDGCRPALAEIWDEGYSDGWNDGSRYEQTVVNPYRTYTSG